MHEIECEGLKKLAGDVQRDCNEGCGCFNPDGCNVPGRRVNGKHCLHPYCDKFEWVIDRAKRYAERLGVTWEEVLDSWEAKRDHWYMNYYQECNQPEIASDRVRVFENVQLLLAAIGDMKFRCPFCGGVSTNPYACNSGIVVDGKVCDWKVGGLFRDLGKGVFVYCKDRLRGELIFKPLAWEADTDQMNVSATPPRVG